MDRKTPTPIRRICRTLESISAMGKPNPVGPEWGTRVARPEVCTRLSRRIEPLQGGDLLGCLGDEVTVVQRHPVVSAANLNGGCGQLHLVSTAEDAADRSLGVEAILSAGVVLPNIHGDGDVDELFDLPGDLLAGVPVADELPWLVIGTASVAPRGAAGWSVGGCGRWGGRGVVWGRESVRERL